MKAFKTICQQLKLIHEHKLNYLYFVYVLGMVSGGLLPIVSLYISQFVLDNLSSEVNEVILVIIAIMGIVLVLTVVKAILSTLSEGVFIKVRIMEFSRCAKIYRYMDYKLVEDAKFNEEFMRISECLDSDSSGFQDSYKKMFLLAPQILTLIGFSVILGIFNFWLVFVILACIVLCVISNGLNLKNDRKIADKNVPLINKMNYYFDTCFDVSAAKDIRAYGLNERFRNNYQSILKEFSRNNRKKAFSDVLINLIDVLAMLIFNILAAYFIIKAYFASEVTLGQVALLFGVVVGFTAVVREMASNLVTLNHDLTEVGVYNDFMANFNYLPSSGAKEAIIDDEGLEIVFDKVSFAYPGSDKLVLKDVSFTIKKGEKLAIVGENGAGKSTIVKLISGLYKPTSGQIYINGIKQEEFNYEEYLSMFATVFQDVNVYTGTIIENVIGSSKKKEDWDFGIECLKRVGLEAKINTFPKGYDQSLTKVFLDDGVEFSGGESQKLAIARALFKGGKMVILDEPTSALDALAEANIYESFAGLVEHKTAIYISHRLSSTKFCDRIMLFTKEGLEEEGTHSELMAKKGKYYELFCVQGKYYRED